MYKPVMSKPPPALMYHLKNPLSPDNKKPRRGFFNF